jgi:transposase-like protein
MPVVATFKTDWFRVINDITRSGIPLQEIARELDVSKSAIIGWKQGAAPNHHTGEALIDFWLRHTAPTLELPAQVTSRRFVYAWRTKRV